MSTRSLLELPEEILTQILYYVQRFGDRLNASLTCKDICRLNEQYLYRDIRFRERIRPKEVLQVFLRRRQVAQLAQSLSLPPWSRSDDYEIDSADADVVRDMDPENSFYGLQTLYVNRWKTRSVINIVLALCPNVRELEFRGVYSDVSRRWFYGLDCAARNKPWPNSFSRLVKLTLQDYDFTNGSARGLIYKCLRIQSLRDFCAKNFTCWTVSDGAGNPFYRPGDQPTESCAVKYCSKVKHLNFSSATLPAFSINDIILTVQNTLATFCLNFRRQRYSRQQLNLTHLITSLAKAADTLTSLDISWEDSSNTKSTCGTLVALGDLVNLKNLRCDREDLVESVDDQLNNDFPLADRTHPSAISATEILPSSLETLEIIHCSGAPVQPVNRRFRNYIYDLAAAKAAEKLPNLQLVSVGGFTVYWVPQRLENTDWEPRMNCSGFRETRTNARFPIERHTSVGELRPLGEVFVDGDGYAVQLGLQLDDPTLTRRRKDRRRWKSLWTVLHEMGIQLEVDKEPYNPEGLKQDADPFSILDEDITILGNLDEDDYEL